MQTTRPSSRLRAGVAISAAVLSILTSNPAHAVGGDNVRVFRSTGGASAGLVHCAVAFSAAGEVFSAVNIRDDVSSIQVHRSTDRGSTWTFWGHIEGSFGDNPVDTIDLVVVEGTPTQLAVVVVDLGDLIVHSADIADSEPTWQSYTVDSGLSYDSSAHIASRAMSGVAGHVYVAYTTNTEALFARSDDGGITFDAPIVLAGFPSDHSTAASLTEDAGNRVRYVWVDNDPTTETSTLSYCEAVNGGAVNGDWNAPIVLDVFDSDDNDVAVSIAGEPGSNHLLVTTQEVVSYDSTTRIYHSADGGGTWDHIGDVAQLHGAQLFWGSEGPGFAAIHDWWSSGYWLARPESTPTSDWAAEVMLSLRPSPVYLAVDGAVDPTSGEFAMVGTSNEIDLCDLWFDGEWRDAPGYGLSEPGAPFDVERIINSAPAIQDVDGDGDRDVVFTTAGDSIGYYDPGADEIVWVGEVGPTSEASAPVVVDVDGDRLYEIFVGTDNGRVHALRADGLLLAGWPVNLGTLAPVYLSAGVITNQAAIEIVAVSANGVWVLWSSGYRALDGARLAPAFGTIVGRAAIGDVGGDGDTEIVVAAEHGVVLLNGDGLEGQVISTPLLTNSAPPSLGDLDGDGDLEITVPRTNGRLGLVHHSGLSYGAGWPFDTGTGLPLGVVVIANSMGGSSAAELHFTAQNGDVYVVDLAGTVVTGWPNGTAVGSEPYEPIVQRIGPTNLDHEVMLGTSNSYARVWDSGTSDEIPGWKRDVWEPVRVAPVADDLDQDGFVELVIPAGSRLWVLDMGVAPAVPRRSWTQSGYDPERRSCWDCEPQIATAVEDPQEANSPAVNASIAVRPNPARGVMHLDVVAPGSNATQAEVRIHDVQGRLVRTLTPATSGSGAFAATWDGTNATGHRVASGVYWARAVVHGTAGEMQLNHRLIRLD